MVRRALIGLTVLLLASALVLAFGAPPEQTQGEFAKMLFVHVPSVITAYVALAIGLGGGLWYLVTRNLAADRLSASAIEIGVVFTALTLVTERPHPESKEPGARGVGSILHRHTSGARRQLVEDDLAFHQ